MVEVQEIEVTNTVSDRQPKILIGTPWDTYFVSAGFCQTLRNMYMPYPSHFRMMRSRHVPDARNALCQMALEGDFTHLMMVDADQHVPQEAFLKLWAVLEEYGHDKTVAFGWSIQKGGKFAGQPSVFGRVQTGDRPAILQPITDIDKEADRFSPAACGTPCLLFDTVILQTMRPPWFADIYFIREDQKYEETSVDAGSDSSSRAEVDVYWPTEYKMGQDVTFSTRCGRLGIQIVIDKSLRLPHETIGTI